MNLIDKTYNTHDYAPWLSHFTELADNIGATIAASLALIDVSAQDKQAKHGYSVNDQVFKALDWAQDKEWFKHPVLVLTDNPGSGNDGWRRPERPKAKYRKNFDSLWNFVKDGKAANIITAYFDRLSRNDTFTINLADECEHQGTGIHCVDKGEHMESPANRLILMVNSAVATEQARTGRGKVTDSIKKRVADGLPPGKVPYGWKNHIRTEAEVLAHMRPGVEPNVEEKKILLMIREQFKNGLTFGQIATKLTALAIPAPAGERWHKTVIAGILMNPFHAGYFTYNKELHLGQHIEQAFWSLDDLAEMKRIYDRRKKTSHPFEHSDAHLLGGIIKCGKCGTPIRFGAEVRIKGGGRYYCESGCRGVRARVDLVDRFVIDQVRKLSQMNLTREIARQEAENILQSEYDDPADMLSVLEKQQSKLKSFMQTNYNTFIRNLASEDQYMQTKRQLEGELGEVERELEQYKSYQKQKEDLSHRLQDVVEVLGSFDKMWANLDKNEQRELLYLACEHLELSSGPDNEAILKVKTFFQPEQTKVFPSLKYAKSWKLGPYGGLMVSWLQCAKLMLEGMDIEQVAVHRNLDLKTTKMYMSKLRRAVGAMSLDEALRVLQPYLDEVDSELLMRDTHGSSRGNTNPLTKVQIEALRIAANSKNGNEAAATLGIGRSAYNARIWSAYQKLGVKDLGSAIDAARNKGFDI